MTNVSLDGLPMAHLRYIQGLSRPTYHWRTLNENCVLHMLTLFRAAQEAVRKYYQRTALLHTHVDQPKSFYH